MQAKLICKYIPNKHEVCVFLAGIATVLLAEKAGWFLPHYDIKAPAVEPAEQTAKLDVPEPIVLGKQYR